MPATFRRYAEPFVGGGALFFDLALPECLVSDSNRELIGFYEVLRDHPEHLIGVASGMRVSKEEYYRVRALDPSVLGEVERAARFIYLNKTCYNGLHRVNRKGTFNTPFGGKANVRLVNEAAMRKASAILAGSQLLALDYRGVLQALQEGDFVYLDPPYWPLGGYSDFKRYTSECFSAKDHMELARHFRSLAERGVKALLSNSCSPEIASLYKGWPMVKVCAKRQINCDATKRGGINELLIANYPFEVIGVDAWAAETN